MIARMAALFLAFGVLAVSPPVRAETVLFVETPAANAEMSGIALISGWAVSDVGIESVRVYFDGIDLGDVPYGGLRGDVANAFPEIPDARHSGWGMKFNYSSPDPGEHEIRVVATDTDGIETEVVRTFQTTGFHLGFIREDGGPDISNATIRITDEGRIRIEGALLDGESVDFDLLWNRSAQQYRIIDIAYPDSPALGNQAPSAEAGSSREVSAGETVSITGTAVDPDGQVVSWQWRQLSGPSVNLSGASGAQVSFIAPDATADVLLELQVTDDDGASDTDRTTVRVIQTAPANQAPSASAGADRSAESGQLVSIQGSGSDADGQISQWRWRQVSGPTVSLQNANSQTVRFIAPAQTGTVSLELTVTDNQGASDSDRVNIRISTPAVVNQAPTANAGPNRSAEAGDTVTIQGSGSDTDGQISGWLWRRISGPAVSLQNATTQTVRFTAPQQAGSLVLELRVTDDDGASDTDRVSIEISVPSTPGSAEGERRTSMLSAINAARAQPQLCHGESQPRGPLPPVSWSNSLAQIALQHSMDMAENDFFSHTSSDGTSFSSRVWPAWSGNRIGENIAAASNNRSDSAIVQLWLDSTSGHCELIMNENMTHVGVGKAWNTDLSGLRYFWTADFGG